MFREAHKVCEERDVQRSIQVCEERDVQRSTPNRRSLMINFRRFSHFNVYFAPPVCMLP